MTNREMVMVTEHVSRRQSLRRPTSRCGAPKISSANSEHRDKLIVIGTPWAARAGYRHHRGTPSTGPSDPTPWRSPRAAGSTPRLALFVSLLCACHSPQAATHPACFQRTPLDSNQ
jgi:hypothetical protein